MSRQGIGGKNEGAKRAIASLVAILTEQGAIEDRYHRIAVAAKVALKWAPHGRGSKMDWLYGSLPVQEWQPEAVKNALAAAVRPADSTPTSSSVTQQQRTVQPQRRRRRN